MKRKNIFLILVGIILALVAWGYLGWFVFKDAKESKEVISEIKENQSANEKQISSDLENSAIEDEKDDWEQVEKSEVESEEDKTEEKKDKKENKLAEKEKEGEEKEEDKKVEREKEKEIKTNFISWGYSTSGRKAIDTIIVHSVYNSLGGDQYSLSKILDIFKNYNVSAHYLVDREGLVHQLVSENHVSWHAGSGKMPDGRTDINAFSVGIEIINAENDKPTAEQYNALDNLIKQIKSRNKIKYVLGHNDVAPGRKTDPWNFDWSRVGGKQD